MGVWRGSPGRLGGSQPHARQPAFRSVCVRASSPLAPQTDGIGLFTGQIGYAWNQALFYVKGGAAVTSNRFSILETLPTLNWPRPARPAGAAPSGLVSSMASHRTGRSVLNTTTCSWAMPIIRSRASPLFAAAFVNNRITQDVDMVTLRLELPLRRLRRTGRSEILISRYFDFSSKLGRQKCRPFCWRLHV